MEINDFSIPRLGRPAWIILVAGAALLAIGQGHAAEGGYSNYIPGTYGDFAVAVEPATKLTLRNDLYYYNAEDQKSVRAGQVELEADLTFVLNMTTLLYKPDVKILGAQYAFGTLVPIVYAEIESGVSLATGTVNASAQDQADAFGLGDITLVPWVLYWNSGNFHTSFAQYIVVPTGDYDKTDSINTSLNYWSFDTNLALTYLNPETGREFSINLGYIYNTENTDTDYQSGQEVHVDYALNQFLSESLALGIQGFYLRQISGDSGDGALLGNFKARAAGIGPALLWTTQIGTKDVSFIVKWLHEFEAERRIEGDHFMASFALGF